MWFEGVRAPPKSARARTNWSSGELTKPLNISLKYVAKYDDSASVQAVTRVNAVQA